LVKKKSYILHRKPKISIGYDFREGPYGGANQFLKGLRHFLISKSIYTESLWKADVVIVNCSPDSLLKLSWRLILLNLLSKKYIVVRIDGPISIIRNGDLWADKLFIQFCNHMADFVIYQSNWSKQKLINLEETLRCKPSKVILNSPDPKLFFPSEKFLLNDSKLRCVISSWSSNRKKGFDIYRALDEHLDHDDMDVFFIGNTPIAFRNIKSLGTMSSKELGAFLRTCHVYITASADDPCSNSLIEAIETGLVPLALNSGGHPEIIQNKGFIFDTFIDLQERLTFLRTNYNDFVASKEIINTKSAYEEYLEICNINENFPRNKKALRYLRYYYFTTLALYKIRLFNKLFKLLK
jgi:hypothetical protein